MSQFRGQCEEGFAPNIRRATAYYFTEKALTNFLTQNNLSHVIRGHELESDGYRFHHSGRLITVFSSSRYCGNTNKAAAIFVDSRGKEGFIKVISLETWDIWTNRTRNKDFFETLVTLWK